MTNLAEQNNIKSSIDALDLIKRGLAYAKPKNPELVEALTLDSSLEELGLESIAALEMAGFIEDELGVEFYDDELSNMNNIRDVEGIILKHAQDK